jgi:MarR family transcriptional regulator, organic hydroperoxide resistance regulator
MAEYCSSVAGDPGGWSRPVPPSRWFEAEPEQMPLGRLLTWTGQALGRHYQHTVAAHGFSSTALNVLGVLLHTDALSHRDLAGHLGITPATLTSVIDALEETGEVVRERDPVDRRIVRVLITDHGRDRLRAAFAEVAAALRERMPRPGPAEQKVIRDYLLAVLAAVDDVASP